MNTGVGPLMGYGDSLQKGLHVLDDYLNAKYQLVGVKCLNDLLPLVRILLLIRDYQL